MKVVMENFNRQTSQRFHEYDERMVQKRKQCREQCDKEIQKIILKDKLEKELMDKFATLHTDIQNDAIPSCFCEKSLADKVEKGCLRCAQNLGGIVVPSSGVLTGIAEGALIVWKPTALDAAKAAAVTEATDLATQEGMKAVSAELKQLFESFSVKERLFDFTKIVNGSNFKCPTALHKSAMELATKSCNFGGPGSTPSFCNTIKNGENFAFKDFANVGATTYDKTLETQTTTLTDTKVGAVEATYGSCQTAITASIIAIVIIILVMVIIYKILRYRRKKKMKKKLQYIKLLEE
ncbi:PIR protein [Plasmodium reichenowi]|uniref:PIR protein n=1 Tax=Plasmodium reichenowi TaxID=5854 RepID=A0A2P9DSS8_PLARE|nr:PIR protein [Plasmodium reichenowi]